jgi:phenylacetate-CoA ligase
MPTWDPTLSEAERYPLMTDEARTFLNDLREHPQAPVFNHVCGDRLDAPAVARIRAWEAGLMAEPAVWRHGEVPAWLSDFAARRRQVPFYRRQGGRPGDFFNIPLCDRGDLSGETWAFVPDDASLGQIILYSTSGTTGHPLDVPWTPEGASMYLPLLRRAARLHGADLTGGPGRTAIALVCFQKRTFTLAQLSFFLDGAGHVKVNLDPDAWRDPGDRAAYLDALDPEIYTGDPISFEALASLPVRARPRALISSSMALLPGLRTALEARFGCPVIDVYSTNETGPIAAGAPDGAGHALLQNRLYVEILDPDGAPCPPGVRGEIVVSGGFNPMLPLLRYRTGDTASLDFAPDGRSPRLVGLDGRAPVVFADPFGAPVNNIEVSQAVRPFALSQWTLRQHADKSLTLRYRGEGVDEAALRRALEGVFGSLAVLRIERAALLEKVRQYARE